MPNYETPRDDVLIDALARFRTGAVGNVGLANHGGAKLRRLGLHVPGRPATRPHDPATPAGAGTTSRGRPAIADTAAPQDSPRADTVNGGTRQTARAASSAARAPEAMLPAQIDLHAAFLDYEHGVAASFARAQAGEPGLTCREWSRRNPFTPAPRPTMLSRPGVSGDTVA